MPTTVANDVARDYAKRFPEAGTRTLARMLTEKEPKLFHDFEAARGAVRHVRGERGAEGRRRIAKLLVPTTKHERFAMPASDAKPVRPRQLKLLGKGLVASDWHIPYHDQFACDLAINHAIDSKHTDFLLVNGDFLDCYMLSRWERDPRKRDFAGELKSAGMVLDSLRGIFKRVIYKFGNHEVRFQSYMRHKAPELIGVSEFRLHRLLKLKRRGVEFVPANRVIQSGRLNIIHGHEYPFAISNPVNPARGLFLRAKASAVCGHFHQSSQHTEADIRRMPTSCWSLGCLCDLAPEYAVLNKWNHGAALLEVDEREEYHVDNFRVVNGKIV